jgi:protein TonB
MVIRQAHPRGYAFGRWLNTSSGRRTPSQASVIGICAAVALHAGLAAYIYNHNFAKPLVESPPDQAPIVVEFANMPQPDKPRPVEAPPHPTVVHQAVETPITPPILLPIAPIPPVIAKIDTTQPSSLITGPVGQSADAAPKAHLITAPNWLSRPSPDELARAYPVRALQIEREGQAELQCAVTAAGTLTGCAVIGETPANFGFGQAALKLSKTFRMSPKTEDGQPVEGGQVRIPLRFTLSG